MGDVGISISSLTVAFIVLKLVGVIDWSWFWILSPTWIPLLIGVLVWVVVRWFVYG